MNAYDEFHSARIWKIDSENSEDSCQFMEEEQHRNEIDHVKKSNDSRDDPFDAILDNYDDDYTTFEYETFNQLVNIPKASEGEVVLAVQCFSVSNSMLRSKFSFELDGDDFSLNLDSGIAVVGVVRDVGNCVSQDLLGIRVSAVLQSAGRNRRYACVKADKIVPIRPGIESTEAVAASYTYFIAFQALMHGIHSPTKRYSKEYFRGKSILIVEGTNAFGQAMIQLSILLGASAVYAADQDIYHDYLKSLGANPLQSDPKQWPETLNESIDIIMVGSRLFRFYEADRVLRNSKGKVVYIGSPMSFNVLKQCSKETWVCLLQQIATQFSLIFSKKAKLRATYYDLFESISNYPEQAKVRSDILDVFL